MKKLSEAPSQINRVKYRDATARDAEAIAGLHADSWRRNYRGAYSDAFLDGDVGAERQSVWRDRFTRQAAKDACTIVAEYAGGVAGFAHTIFAHDPKWGASLDNLHVRHDLRAHGIGTQLMAESARAVIKQTPSSGLYLWVLEGNKAAQAFYAARGGTCTGRESSEAPGGGTIIGLRYAWPDPSVLLGRWPL